MTARPSLAFFLRHHNDIDHVIPVAYALAEQGRHDLHLVVCTHPAYLTDARLRLLAPFPTVTVHHIMDFAPLTPEQRKQAYAEVLGDRPPDEVNFPEIWERWFGTPLFAALFERLFGKGRRGAVVFDWTTSPFTRMVTRIAASQGLPGISLPHGVKVFSNLLVTKDNLNFDPLLKATAAYSIFDHVVLPNRYWRDFFATCVDPAKLHQLGSPRFCERWRAMLPDMALPFRKDVGDALRVVLFLRDQGYDIFWEEVVRTYRLILQFPGVHLLVRHHPRSCAQGALRDQHPALFDMQHDNLTILADRTSSSALIDWADVVVDGGTSMACEAVLKGKPVLCLEYIHPNRTLLVEYVTACELRTRDDLFHNIKALCADRTRPFYDPAEVQAYRDNVLDDFHPDVLGRYVDFFNSIVPA